MVFPDETVCNMPENRPSLTARGLKNDTAKENAF